MTFCFLSMSPPKMMSSPLPCTTVCRLVSGGPVTAPLPKTRHPTTPSVLAREMSSTYICMGLQLSAWYSGFPTFRLCGGTEWPRRRAIGGIECPSTCGGLDEAGLELGAGFEEDEDDDGDDDERDLTASRPLRSAAGETAPGGV